MDTMMALRAHARGGPEQLSYEQAPRPAAGPGEALLAVHAAGITFDELTWDLSWTTSDGADRTPVIPSHEVSGTVVATGPGTTGLAPGDEVFALIDFNQDGAAAEYVTVPASALAARPRSVSHTQAATLPLAALTAWQALVDHASLARGERVLVLGGAGGVGVYAVQLAAALGGQVTATGRSHSEAFVLALGATDFISSRPGAGGAADGQDVIIDTVGGQALADSFALYLKTKNFHWHLSGPHFRDYHLLFDDQASQIFAMTDVIAERVRKLGGQTLKSIGQIARLQHLADNEAEGVTARDMLAELLRDNRSLGEEMKALHARCESSYMQPN